MSLILRGLRLPCMRVVRPCEDRASRANGFVQRGRTRWCRNHLRRM